MFHDFDKQLKLLSSFRHGDARSFRPAGGHQVLDGVPGPGSRLKPLLQQQPLISLVWERGGAKPVASQRAHRSSSWGAAGLGFALMAGGAVDHGLGASRLKPLLQEQHQQQRLSLF